MKVCLFCLFVCFLCFVLFFFLFFLFLFLFDGVFVVFLPKNRFFVFFLCVLRIMVNDANRIYPHIAFMIMLCNLYFTAKISVSIAILKLKVSQSYNPDNVLITKSASFFSGS